MGADTRSHKPPSQLNRAVLPSTVTLLLQAASKPLSFVDWGGRERSLAYEPDTFYCDADELASCRPRAAASHDGVPDRRLLLVVSLPGRVFVLCSLLRLVPHRHGRGGNSVDGRVFPPPPPSRVTRALPLTRPLCCATLVAAPAGTARLGWTPTRLRPYVFARL